MNKKKLYILLTVVICLAFGSVISWLYLAGCGGGGGGVSGCPGTAYPADTTGCTLTAVSPGDCAVISLPYNFEGNADACATPYYIYIYGNPPSKQNSVWYQVTYTVINAPSWAFYMKAEYLTGSTTDNGWYHWRVGNAYESAYTASRAFKPQ